ncbi:MAG: thioredoxin family protein [Fidelibacterota bacterium]|nr:MAG: thioredoxin family protein [Candidatus Neomarinimicrobiota bacterium]
MRVVTMLGCLALTLVLVSFSEVSPQETVIPENRVAGDSPPKITFIELGSVRCIPCRAMQPVMQAIEQRYGEQIQIIFYDVWRPDQRHYGTEYGIKLIPTQIFLDSTGTEIMRHQGFFPEKEIVEFLDAQGLKSIIAE